MRGLQRRGRTDRAVAVPRRGEPGVPHVRQTRISATTVERALVFPGGRQSRASEVTPSKSKAPLARTNTSDLAAKDIAGVQSTDAPSLVDGIVNGMKQADLIGLTHWNKDSADLLRQIQQERESGLRDKYFL